MAESILSLANCGQGVNTGAFGCFFNPSIYDRFIMAPKGTVIPNSVLIQGEAAVREYIEDGLKADNESLRWHMSGRLSQLQDNTEARKTENKNGRLFTTQFPPYSWTYDMEVSMATYIKWKVGYNLTAQAGYDFLFVDVNGVLIGTGKEDSTGAAGIGGASLYEFAVEDSKQATPDTLVKFLVTLGIENNKQLNENLQMVKANIVPSDWDTLVVDAVIVQGPTANTATAINIRMYTDGVGAKTSILKSKGADLDAAAAWVVKKNGAVITPSAVAYDAADDEMTFTVSSLSSLDVVTVDLAALSVVSVSPYYANYVTEGTQYTYTHP